MKNSYLTTHKFLRLWLLLFCFSVPAMAEQDLITQRAILVDPQGSFNIEDVQTKPFRSVSGPVGLGYSKNIVWLRIEVTASALPELRLMVQPGHLDNVQLYSQRPDRRGWTVQQQGDRFPFTERPLSEIYFNFPIYPSATQPTIHYLRVTSTGSLQVHVRAQSPADSASFDSWLHVMVGLYSGLLMAMLLFALVCWRITRDWIWGVDALFQLASVLWTFFVMGFAARYLLPNYPEVADLATSVMAASHLAAGSLFIWRLLVALKAPIWNKLPYFLEAAVYPVLIVLIFSNGVRVAMTINSNILLLQSIIGGFLIWRVKIEDRLLLWLIRTFFVSLSLYIIYFVLPLLGLTQMTELHLYPALLSNLFSSAMLQAILARRMQLQIRERWQLQTDVLQLDQKLQFETQRHAATSSFLSMMMHELKTPLTAIRLATQSLVGGRAGTEDERARRLSNIQKSVDNIDAVLERCVEVDRLEQGALTVQRQRHDVAALLSDWISIEVDRRRLAMQLPLELWAEIDAPLTCLMLRNLMHNALTYSPTDSIVDVVLIVRPDGFTIEVSNEIGRAGSPDPQQLFSKYYRADTAKYLTGTGLGLYWVQRVAVILGGTVGYRRDGNKVRFELWLPN